MEKKNPMPSIVSPSTVVPLERGKLPPQVVDFEEVVLGAMMIDKKGVDEVIDIYSLKPFIARHISIFFPQWLSFLRIQSLLIF
jgi:replicative DNA helicase